MTRHLDAAESTGTRLPGASPPGPVLADAGIDAADAGLGFASAGLTDPGLTSASLTGASLTGAGADHAGSGAGFTSTRTPLAAATFGGPEPVLPGGATGLAGAGGGPLPELPAGRGGARALGRPASTSASAELRTSGGASPGASGTAGPRTAGPNRAGVPGAGLAEVSAVLEPRGILPGQPTGPEWATCADLTSRDGVTQALARIRAADGASSAERGASNEVAASYLANWYAAAVVGPAISAYMLMRRVPELAPTGMSLHRLDSGWFDRTALHRLDVTVLPDDPILLDDGRSAAAADDTATVQGGACAAAVRNGAFAAPEVGGVLPAAAAGVAPWRAVRVVDDPDALRGVLVEAVLSHLGPFVEQVRAQVRLGLPALWGAVAGQCARAFLLTERATGDPAAGRDEADAFFERAAPTLRARPRWHQFDHRGRTYVGMRCGSCCLAHRLGEEHCTTCPFTNDTDRERRMRAWIDTQGSNGLAV